VFGITEFTIPATDWRFALTMVLVCIPFMALIFLLQTRIFTLVVANTYSLALAVVTFPYRYFVSGDQDPDNNRSTVYLARRKRRLATGRAGTSSRWKWQWQWPWPWPWASRHAEGDIKV
jgi:hypothetical protein